jgi:CIC family chloride channel protein
MESDYAADRVTARIWFVVSLLLVSLGAALFAVSFRAGLTWWYRSVFDADNVVAAIARLPWWMRLAVPTAGGFAAGLVSRWRKPASQGVSNVMEAVVLGNVTLSMRATLSRVSSSALAIAAGMSIGREGPLIEFGGALGAAIGRHVRLSLNDTRVLVASGTAAGFAAAYNTPFAAVLFIFETIIGIAAPTAVLPAMAATVIAALVTRTLVGAGPIYGQRAFEVHATSDLWWLVALGAAGALVAAGFKWSLSHAERLAEGVFSAQPWRASAGGLTVGLLAVWIPDIAGNGFEPLNQILNHELLTVAVTLLLVMKIIATSLSVASGVPGGIFTPMLLVGAATGSLWAQVVSLISPSSLPDAGAYALVGMAAATAASIHAPLTAAVLVFELSGDYAIVLPLILATTIATSLSRAIGGESVYVSELRRRGLAWELTLEGRQIEQDSAPITRS